MTNGLVAELEDARKRIDDLTSDILAGERALQAQQLRQREEMDALTSHLTSERDTLAQELQQCHEKLERQQ